MKKQLLKSMLLLCALVVGSSNVWADEILYYTLDGSVTTGGNSNYAQDGGGLTQSDIEWSVTGNTTINPWRIGGKSLTNEDREAYSKTAMGSAISKIELELGDINLTSVNSIKLIVASNSDFSTEIESFTETSITANTTLTFTPTAPATEWATGAYYKFVFNVTAPSSNKYVQLISAKFYKNGTATDPTITFSDGNVRVGKTLDLSDLFTSDSDGDVTYSITAGDSYASLDGKILTGVAEGSVTVKAEQAASGAYNAGEATATITVEAAPDLSSIAITTAPSTTTYTEGETFDPTGMVVTATYSDASTDDVTALCTFTPSGALTTSDTEITVSYTENAVEKTATQAITVNPYIQPTTVTFNITQAMFDGVTFNGSSQTTETTISTTVDNVDMTINKGGANTYVKDGEFRCYKDGTLVFDAPAGYVITEIEFTKGTNWGMSGADTGNLDSQTWTATSNTSTVSFGFSGRTDITKVVVTLAKVENITISAATWATFSSTQEVEIPAGVTAYYAQKKDASTVTLKEITGGYIPANTGVVVSGTAGTYTANFTTTGATLDEENLLKAWTTAGEPTDKTYYTLAVSGGNPVFKLSTGGTLAAGKAYLVMPAGARELSVDFGGQTTGIDEVRGQKEDVRGEYFNLAGQRVAQPTRGLYIVNGKKVVVK